MPFLRKIVSSFLSISLVVLTLGSVFALSGHPQKTPKQAPPATKTPSTTGPKLVLLIVIDQFRQDYFSRFSDLYGEGGFRRLLKNGAFFANANYLHACTYTACGHAVVMTGSIPALTGIISNQWYERETNQVVTSVQDTRFMGVPNGRGGAPSRLLVTTLGDQLRLANNRQSQVIGVSLKDRSAMLPAGKSANAAYWFDTNEGKMQTSTYYMDHFPAWAEAFNARKIPDSYFGKTWDRLLPEAAYARSDRDDAPYEKKLAGDSNKFPHVVTGGGTRPNPKFYDDFTRTPWGNDLLLEFTQTLLENENLGQDDYTDVLTVSFSSFDIVGHAFGPYSQEMQDMAVRTDQTVAKLLDLVDKRVGLANTLVILTGDHGAAPIPEYSQEKHLGGRRILSETVGNAVNRALTEKFGEGNWISDGGSESIYLNLETIRNKKLDRSEVEKTVGEAALTVPGVATYFTRTQLLNGPLPPTEIAKRVAAAFNPLRSGDVYLVPEPYAFFEEGANLATTHGTPYSYDTHVPIVMMGRGIRPGRYFSPSSPSDIAPTLAALLNVENPNGNVGRVLVEALDGDVPVKPPTSKPKVTKGQGTRDE